MKAGRNRVMIKSPRTFTELRTNTYSHKSGLQIKKIEAAYEASGHNTSNGTVIDVGHLWYEKGGYLSLKWKTKNQLQAGDEIVYYYNDDAWGNGNHYIDGEDVYFFIRYDSVYFAIRDGKIIPVNGYNLIEPIIEQKKSILWTPEKTSKKWGYVRHVGEPLEEVSMSSEEKPINDEVMRLNGTKHAGYGLKEGDYVMIEPWGAKPIAYNTQNIWGNYYATHRMAMVCVIEDKDKIEI